MPFGKVKFMQPIEFVCDIVPLLITIIDGFLRKPGKRCGLVRHLLLVGKGCRTICCAWTPGGDGLLAMWWKSFDSGDSITLSLPRLLTTAASAIKRTSTRANKTILARSTAECIFVSLLKFMHWLCKHLFRSFLGGNSVFLLQNPPSMTGCCSEMLQLAKEEILKKSPYIMNLKSW